MPWTERVAIIKALKCVDYVLLPFDDDDGSSIGAIKMLRMLALEDHIIFANGGDRTNENIPEMSLDIPNLEFAFGVGGEDKKNSSSWILNEWKAPKTDRVWGEYRVLHEVEGCKVKELTVMPGRTLSMQKHSKRKEYWVVTEGKCKVEKEYSSLWLHKHETMFINTDSWHQLSNPFDVPCRLVEIQYGEECIEEDIERK
jgi:mannose-6-phosphate isomerase-like protein (cupin superfamily)